jgi:hypothetical protein
LLPGFHPEMSLLALQSSIAVLPNRPNTYKAVMVTFTKANEAKQISSLMLTPVVQLKIMFGLL